MDMKLNGRLKHVARTVHVNPANEFSAAEAFSAESALFKPYGFQLDGYCCHDQLMRIVEKDVPRSVLKFHRLTEGPAVLDQIVERFGERSFVRAAHVASYMQRLAQLFKNGQHGDLGATVNFLVRAGDGIIPIRVGAFDYHDDPKQRFTFGATHELPDIHMGLIAHY